MRTKRPGQPGETDTKESGMDVDNACRMCGNCCYFEIPLTLMDVARLGRFLGRNEEAVFRDVVHKDLSRRSGLFKIRKRPSGACLFLSERQACSVHEAKPGACSLFVCSLQQETDRGIMPWTANCLRPSDRSTLWSQSVAAAVTRTYIERHGTAWCDADFQKAIRAIEGNVKVRATQKLKLTREENGVPMALLYDCDECSNRGECARETPVTLDDARRLVSHLGMSWDAFFREVLGSQASEETGCFKLKRGHHCVFFDDSGHCSVETARPMHCRFTPCPARAGSAPAADRLFLGSGTVPEQFRHQVAMALTRKYVSEIGIRFDRERIRAALEELQREVANPKALERFCRLIAPYRYVDDTLRYTGAVDAKGKGGRRDLHHE